MDWLTNWIFDLLYSFQKTICYIIDFIREIFYTLAGIDTVNINGEQTDLLSHFILSNTVKTTFFYIFLIAIILLVVFVIIAIIRSEYAYGDNKKSKGQILAKSFQSFAIFLMVPFILIAGITLTNVVMGAINQSMNPYILEAGGQASLGGQILVTSGQFAYIGDPGSRAEIVEEGNRQRIIITELPYQVNKARFIMQMADMVKNKRLEGISDIKEESDRDGMRVVVDVKKDANAQVVLNMLYKHTMLQQSSGIIFLALVGREPKILNLKEILYYYLEHQKDVLIRKTKFDLARAEERAHIVKGLVIALANIDEVIKIIKNSADKPEAMQKLMENFELSEKQANAILEMKLSRLTSLEVEKLNEELRELEATIAELKSILDSPAKVLSIIRNDLEEVKQKYGTPRRTEISVDMGGIDVADLIEKEEVVISMTHQGYIKRMSASEYKAQRRGGVGVTAHKTKDEDFVEKVYATNSHADLLMFSNQGRVYSIKAYEVPEASRQAKGRAMINLLQIAQDEKISEIVPNPEERDLEGSLIMATKNGLIKKTKVSEYENIRKSGKIAIKLNEGDELIGVGYVKEDGEILVASSGGKCARFNERDVRQVGRDSMGVKSMTLEEGESVVSMAVVKPDSMILTISENGYGKRTPASEFRLTARGAKGVKAGVFNEKTGGLVGLVQVEEDEDLMLIADSGISIRTPIKDISIIGRVSQGVIVMKLKDGAKLVAFAVTEHEEQDESQAVSEENEVPQQENQESEVTVEENNNEEE